MHTHALTLGLLVAGLVPTAASLAQVTQSAGGAVDRTVEITEWTVPWEKTRPRDPYVASDGRVFFVGQAGNYIAVLDPKNGQFKRFEIDPGTNPHNLIVDRQGMVWYAGNRNGMIGKLDPHTLVFDQAGNIWFTAQQSNYVGRLNTGTGKVDLVKVATADSRPYGIVVDASGRPWFNEFGVPKIASIDPKTLEVREFALPHDRARGRRIGLTSDGKVWYVDYTRGFVSRLDPATGKVDEWAAPSGPQSMPYAMAVDDRDRIWYVETGVRPNRLVGFDPKKGEVFNVTPIAKSGGLSVRHMVYHAPTRAIWFGTDAGTIARAKIE